MLINIRRKQKGQALPIGIALFLVLGLMSFVLFNTGQTVSDKSRIVNTADSAVYSGLLWQARAMNFQAYTNRAMVANQVAMAQAVSINSWSAYIKKTGQNLNDAFGWVPYVGAVTRIIEKVGEAIDMVLDPVSRGMLAVVNAVNMSLSIAQEAMFYSAFVATPDVVDSVVKSNEPDNQNFKWATAFSVVNAGINMYKWNQFTESSDEHKELAENERFHMINASMDKFSKERNWKFFNFFIPITPLNWVRFEKAGTTVLIRKDGKYEWHAKDALSLREKRYTWRGKKYKDLPISGGSALANTDNADDSILGQDPVFFGGRHRTAQRRNHWSSAIFHEGRSMKYYGGIHAYRSLSKKMRDQEDPPTMKLRIQISMKTDDTMDSDVITEVEPFKASVVTPGDVLSSVSTAEMFFEKPCFDANCIEEFANGYSPYWDVRLINTSGLSRLAAHITQPDVLTDAIARKDASLERLPNYSPKMANPITDYQEQAKGVKVVIAGMENHLKSLVVDSPEYQSYKAKLQGIKDNVTFEIESIADQFVEQNLSEEQVVDEIAKAAGYDFDIGEFKAVKQYIADVYPDLDRVRNMTIEDVKEEVMQGVNQKVDELTETVKEELTGILKDAVRNILAGMVASFIEQQAGITIPGGVIDDISEEAANQIVNRADNEIRQEGSDSDDIAVDVSNECSIYRTVNEAEQEVEELQRKLEAVNQQIANEFHDELKLVTDASVARRDALSVSIDTVRDEIAFLKSPANHMNEEDEERAIRDKQDYLDTLIESRDNVPNDRVETLTDSLMRISNDATATVFPGYRLERRFAREAVIETLGDINKLEVDENGETVAENLFFAEAENELNSDTEQSFTEKPEGC